MAGRFQGRDPQCLRVCVSLLCLTDNKADMGSWAGEAAMYLKSLPVCKDWLSRWETLQA